VFDWTVDAYGALTVEASTPPKAVTLWQLTNPFDRDFRLSTTGANWSSTPLPPQEDGTYVSNVPGPLEGWTAYFIELVFDGRELGGIAFDYTLSTEIVILPQTRPFEADLNRDRVTDLRDLMVFCENWLTDNSYRDIWPRRQGDAAVNFHDFALLGTHWGQ